MISIGGDQFGTICRIVEERFDNACDTLTLGKLPGGGIVFSVGVGGHDSDPILLDPEGNVHNEGEDR